MSMFMVRRAARSLKWSKERKVAEGYLEVTAWVIALCMEKLVVVFMSAWEALVGAHCLTAQTATTTPQCTALQSVGNSELAPLPRRLWQPRGPRAVNGTVLGALHVRLGLAAVAHSPYR